MKAKQIKEILSDFLEGSNFSEINDTINLETLWKNHVGKIISNNTEVVSFKKGTLIIKTSSPVWRNELHMQEKDLINKIKEKESGLYIKEIIFR